MRAEGRKEGGGDTISGPLLVVGGEEEEEEEEGFRVTRIRAPRLRTTSLASGLRHSCAHSWREGTVGWMVSCQIGTVVV